VNVLECRIPAPEGTTFTEEEAEKMEGQYLHVLFGGTAHLAQVRTATLYDQGTSVYLACAVEPPPADPDATPLEVDHDGEAYPEVEAA
jgi:hypothetical protein